VSPVETNGAQIARRSLLQGGAAIQTPRPETFWIDVATIVAWATAASSLPTFVQRRHAAESLAVFRDPAAVVALVKALDDPAALVRYHAARGLLTIHGLTEEADVMSAATRSTCGDTEHMMYRVMADDLARREGGKRDILAAMAVRPISVP
jgi:HEAT repeat protein